MKEIRVIFEDLRRGLWASPPDPKDADTASSQRLEAFEKGATLCGTPQTTDISRYQRQLDAEIECGS